MRMFHRLPAAVSSAKLSNPGGVVERSIAPVLKSVDPTLAQHVTAFNVDHEKSRRVVKDQNPGT